VPTPTPSSASTRLQQAWLTRGPLARLLWPLALLYGAVVALRQWLYRSGLLHAGSVPVPVLVVGNLVAGGAGKTPTVLAVLELLRRRGWTPGVVSRGYGREGDGLLEVHADTPARTAGDEPLLIRLRSRAPVWVGRDRPAAVCALCHAHPEVDIVVSDDGLQHLPLPRVATVIVFDERGAGNGWLLPAGPLRSPLTEKPPPGSVVLYNAAAPSTAWPGHLARRRLAGVVELGAWWRGEPATPEAWAALRGRPVWAAAGLARPQRFFSMLREQGIDVRPLPLPDHHGFDTLPWPADAPDVVLTEKDAVKLPVARAGNSRVWVAALDFQPDAGFDTALAALLPPPPART